MEAAPIAFDSMGVRSMATFVRTKDVRITIDPSVSLAPKRYKLPPHRIEIERMNEKWEEIRDSVLESDVIVITHYHYDHHNPDEVDIFDGKTLLLKHPKENINRSQMGRAAYFLERLKNVDVEIDFCDGKSYTFGSTDIIFSRAVYHGADSRLGYVVEVFISDGDDSLLFSSDVEGPNNEDQVGFMLEMNAGTVIIDGPMTYMLGYRFSQRAFQNSIENLRKLIERTDIKNLVLDHHLTRDLKWRDRMADIFKLGEEAGVTVDSAAGFAGIEEELLEARRAELYKKYKN